MTRGSTRSTLGSPPPSRAGAPRKPKKPARRALSPIAFVKAIFTHHVRVKRAPEGLKVVLEPQPTQAAAPAKAPKAKGAPGHKDHIALRMHDDLAAALNAAPGSRRVFRALATVEHHLWCSGALFLMDLPLPALQRIGEQLEGIAKPPVNAGLKALIERVSEAIAQQEKLAREREMLLPPSSFFVDHKMEVGEASPSIFIEMTGRPLNALNSKSAHDTETPALWAS